jgi:hypothetical protein
LGLCDTDKFVKRDVDKDVFRILQSKSKEAQSNDFVNKLYADHKQNFGKKKLIKVALMSDIHIDYDYTPGADNDCGMPLCCRSDSGLAPTKERAAGKWGDYRCDMNSLTLASMFDYISN